MTATTKAARDDLGSALGWRQDSRTGTWAGRCPRCGNDGASVGNLSMSCACGTLPLEAATRLYAGGVAAPGGCAVGTLLSDVEPTSVAWLWPGRIPLGRLTILDGDPGLGKSSVTLDLTARVSRGDTMPDGSRGVDRARGVVLLGAEDGLSDTVRPRLDAAGADVARVYALQGVRDGGGRPRLPTVADVAALEEARDAVNAALLIVDPLSAYMGSGVDAHRDTDVRQALAALAELAERSGLAVLAVRHLSKSGGANALYRGGGSIAIIAAARSGLLLAADPDDPECRVLASTKNNLAPPQPSLSLRLATSAEGVHVEWLGVSSRRAGDLLADDEQRSAQDEAADLLRTELAGGPRPTKQIQARARDAGISWSSVRRAKDALGVVVARVGFGEGSAWTWSLPGEDAQHPWAPSEAEGVSAFGKAHMRQGSLSAAAPEGAQGESLGIFGENGGDLPDLFAEVDDAA